MIKSNQLLDICNYDPTPRIRAGADAHQANIFDN